MISPEVSEHVIPSLNHFFQDNTPLTEYSPKYQLLEKKHRLPKSSTSQNLISPQLALGFWNLDSLLAVPHYK